MNTNENIEPSGERDELHELLCAYVLGEASEAEAERVEAELKVNESLCAERDRLEATIGLVKRFAPEATLSDAAHEKLAEETGGGAKIISIAWYRRPTIRAAAAMLVAVGAGFAALPYLTDRMPAPEGRMAESAVVGSAPEVAEPPAQKSGNARSDGGEVSLDLKSEALDSRDDAAPAEERELLDSEKEALLREIGYVDPTRLDSESAGYRGPGDSVPPGSAKGDGTITAGLEALGAATRRAESPSLLSARSTTAAPSSEPILGVSFESGSGNLLLSGAQAEEQTRGLHSLGYLETLGYADGGGDSSAWMGLPDSEVTYFAESLEQLERAGYLVHDESELLIQHSLSGQDPSEMPETLYDALALGSPGGSNRYYMASTSLDFVRPQKSLRVLESELLNRLQLEDTDSSRIDLLKSLGYVGGDFEGSLEDPAIVELRIRVISAQAARQKIEALIEGCHRRPGESLKDMFFRHWGSNPAVKTSEDPLSTFAIDVDTASYTLARGMLERGFLPTREQIRPEEWVNYFDPEVEAPVEDTFGLATELAPNPFGPNGSWLFRAVVKAKDVLDSERDSLALVFVVDVSGSMDTDNRIELVKDALRQLLTKLDGRDRIALVAFSNKAEVVLPMTPADRRGEIERAILGLTTGGGTNVESGLMSGYELAAREFDAELQNRVVLLSDGVGNIGKTDQDDLLEEVSEHRAKGIYLNTIGFGITNHNDEFLEQLADGGDGLCNYVDSPVEARRAFVDNFTGAFMTVARDAKIQVEFDPLRVGSYRLIGYENRALADREFRQDSVDAGEVGAGQQVVAIYELFDVDLSGGQEAPLGTLRTRFKPPFGDGGDEARELALPFGASVATFDYTAASSGFRKSTLVAQIAEVLRRSWHTRDDSMMLLAGEIERLANQTSDPDFKELAALFERNRAAVETNLKPVSDNQKLVDELKKLRYELEREKEAAGDPDPELVASYERRIADREAQLRETVLSQRSEER